MREGAGNSYVFQDSNDRNYCKARTKQAKNFTKVIELSGAVGDVARDGEGGQSHFWQAGFNVARQTEGARVLQEVGQYTANDDNDGIATHRCYEN